MAQTVASDVSNAAIELMKKYFFLTFQDNLIFKPDSELITFKEDVGGKSIEIVDYDVLSVNTSELTDGTAITPKGMSDNTITLTPAEHGDAVRTTKLATIHTQGHADLAAAKGISRQASESINSLGISALKTTTNSFIANSVGAEGSLTASDTLQKSDVLYAHNRLRRNNVPKLPGGNYVAVANEDIISDIKNLDGWVNVQKYANATKVLAHELGSFGGFRWVGTMSNGANADAGDANVDTYDTVFMGAGSLAYAVSYPVRMVVSKSKESPLQRFADVGWYGVVKYDLIKNTSVWVCTSASSYGTNT